MGKLFTSRYSNKSLDNASLVKVGISRGTPRFPLKYQLAENLIELAPSSYIFRIENKAVFEKKYKEQLDKLGCKKIKSLLEDVGYGGEKDVVLLCYEDVTCDDPKKNWCHRTYLAEWIRENLKIEVTEYPDENCFAKKAERKAEKEKEVINDSLDDQLKLF